MRLAYVPKDAKFDNADDQATIDRVKQRRGSAGLIELDRALLHAPPIADGWNSFLGSIRSHSSLPASVRETAICRVAVLTKAWYEWDQHAPILRAATNVTDDDVSAVLNTPPRAGTDAKVSLDERHSAVLAYTDAMTLDVTVRDEVFARLKTCFGEKEIVEITATVAAYNCVSRFLVALDVGEKNGQGGPGEDGARQ